MSDATTSLPPDLQAACMSAGLRVLRAPFGEDQAVLWNSFGEDSSPYLFVEETWPQERVEWTVRQSLADLGEAEFEDVPVEPFGEPLP